MPVRSIALRLALAASLLCGGLAVSACSPPPALPKKVLDAKKLPKVHPKVADKQKQNCRGCHREGATVKK